MRKLLLILFTLCMIIYMVTIIWQGILVEEWTIPLRSLTLPLWHNGLGFLCVGLGLMQWAYESCVRIVPHGGLFFIILWDVVANLGILLDPFGGVYLYLLMLVNSLLFEWIFHHCTRLKLASIFSLLLIADFIYLMGAEGLHVACLHGISSTISDPLPQILIQAAHTFNFPLSSIKFGHHHGYHGSLFGEVILIQANLSLPQQHALFLHDLALRHHGQALLHQLLYLTKHAVLRMLTLLVLKERKIFLLFGFDEEPGEVVMAIADVFLMLFEGPWRVIENAVTIGIGGMADRVVQRTGAYEALIDGLQHDPRTMKISTVLFDYLVSGTSSLRSRMLGK